MDTGAVCLLIALLLALAVLPAEAKTERTLFTPDRIANALENIQKYDWAKKTRDATVSGADKFAAVPYDQLARYIPDPRIPRSVYVHETGCPNCGLEIRKHGTYAWIISEDAPYKVKCPNCGKVYPDSDYQAFIDTDFKDRSVLKGEIVDDGWGWTSPQYGPRQKYWFVGYYNHWMSQRHVHRPMWDLSEAYMYTGDPRYARACAVLLWQLAKYYPGYDYAKQSRRGLELDPSYHGRLFYYTWECYTMQTCAKAYDAIFPALLEPCPELEQLTGQSMGDIRHLIEEQLLRSQAREVVNETGYICGNWGMHQVGLLQVAAVLKDTPGTPSSEEMIDWVLNSTDYRLPSFMPIYDALYNLVYRDGNPHEAPGGYNREHVETLTQLAQLLRLSGVDVTKIPRFRKLYDWGVQMRCAGNFSPALGDAGYISNRAMTWQKREYLFAYQTYRDPVYAAFFLNMFPDGGQDIFEPCMTDEMKAAAAQLKTPLGYESQHMPGYGLAILQNGNPQRPVAGSLFYGRFIGHSHRDKMQLDIFAENCSMIPDLGAPETANSNDPRRAGFFFHNVAHNTVMVDQSIQTNGRGRCLAYDAGPVCQYVEAQNDSVYPQCHMYRRSVAMIEVSPGQSYFIDIFRVQGGTQHDWLVHGTNADFASNLALTEPRKEGTLAGPDVKFGHYYDDERLGAAPYGSVSYFGYKGSGFQFLYNVQEANLAPGAYGKWSIITRGDRAVGMVTGSDGAYIKAFLVGDDERTIVCDGKPQQNRRDTPESVKFLIRRRTGDNLASTFTTVFEPGAGEEFIKSVTPVATGNDDLVALKIELTSGATHYYFNATEPVQEAEIADGIRFAGQVGYLGLDAQGEVQNAYLHNATRLARGDWKLDGDAPATTTIASCDYRANTVTLADPVLAGRDLPGATVIMNTGGYGSAFVVKGVDADSKLLFGDQEPICSRACVKQIKAADRQLVTPTEMCLAQPAMHVVNEAFEPVAKLLALDGGILTLDRDFTAAQFPDADGDGAIRAYIMEFGPGDTVLVPSSIRYQRH